MDAESANKAIAIRLFHWALQEWEHELGQGFPLLLQVKGNAAAKAIEMFEHVAVEDRGRLARALVKRFHKDACVLLEDPITENEARLLRLADEMRTSSTNHQPPTSLDRSLRKAIVAHLKRELAFLGVPESLGRPTEWRYATLTGTWRVVTHLEAVGRFGDCSYSHTIESLSGVPVSRYLSILSLLGVSSQSKWRVGGEQEAADVAVAIGRLCRSFLDGAPDLLRNVTIDS